MEIGGNGDVLEPDGLGEADGLREDDEDDMQGARLVPSVKLIGPQSIVMFVKERKNGVNVLFGSAL